MDALRPVPIGRLGRAPGKPPPRRVAFPGPFPVLSPGTTQVGAVSDGIGQALAMAGKRPSHIEGGAEASWVLMDYGDVVVHIFEDQTRMYYSLERLWGDAPRVAVPAKTGSAAP